MSRIWSEQGGSKLARVELAALDGWRRSTIPAADVAAIRCGREAADARARRDRADDRTTTSPLVDAVAEQLGRRRWVHYDSPSSDVVDTGAVAADSPTPAKFCSAIDRAPTPSFARAEQHRIRSASDDRTIHASRRDVRLEARGLALRARPRPRAPRPRGSSRNRVGQLSGTVAPTPTNRFPTRAHRLASARPRGRPGFDAGDWARPARGSCSRCSRSSRPHSIASRRRSATSHERRCARSDEPFAPA